MSENGFPLDTWLRMLADSAWFAVVVVEDRRIVLANPAASRLTATPVDELVGLDPFELLHPEDREVFSDSDTTESAPVELRVRGFEGSWHWVAVTVERYQSDGRTLFLSTGMDITARRQAEEKLARRLQLQNALSEISRRFLSLPPESFDEGIHHTLEQLATICTADRAYLFRFTGDFKRMSNTHEWCAPGVSSEIDQLQGLELRLYPWLEAAFASDEIVHIPSVAELPSEAAAERREFEREEIKSLVLVPCSVAGRHLGFIGFDAVKEERQWDNDALNALQVGGAIVGSALQRNMTLKELQTSRERLELAQKAGRGAAWAWDPTTDAIEFSEHVCEIFGTTPENVPHNSRELFAMIPENDRAAITSHVRTALECGERYSLEHRLVTPDGNTVWLAVSGQPVPSKNGCTAMVMGVSADITERKRAEKALIEEKERAQVTLRCIADGVIRTDDRGRVDFINPAAEVLTGVFLADAVGRPVNEIYHVREEESGARRSSPVIRCLQEGRSIASATPSILITADGTERTVRDSAAPIRGADGNVIGAVLVFKDITEIRRLEREMEYLATHDPLTGLINRREFSRLFAEAVAAAARADSAYVLCYLDLDDFKRVNDSCGHAAGDEMLQQLTALMAQQVREEDTVARLGGDEFAILLSHCELEDAERRTRQLLAAIQGFRFQFHDQHFNVGASVGLVPIIGGATSPESLLGTADAACYEAKDRGRNQIVIAGTPGLHKLPG